MIGGIRTNFEILRTVAVLASLIFSASASAGSQIALPDLNTYQDGYIRYSEPLDYFANELLSNHPAKSPPTSIKPPYDWTKVKGLDRHGYGTFVLTVNSIVDQEVALLMDLPRGSSRIFINSIEVREEGNVSPTPNDDRVSYKTDRISKFHLQKGPNELWIEMSNWHEEKPGFVAPLYFGTYDSIQRKLIYNVASGYFIMGVLLFIGILHMLLYFVRRTMTANLYLSMLCFGAILYEATTASAGAIASSMSLDMVTLFTVYHGSWIILQAIGPLYYQSIVPGIFSRTYLRCSTIFWTLACCYSLLVDHPSAFTMRSILAYLMLPIMIYSLYRLTKMIRPTKGKVLYLFIPSAFTIPAMINDILNAAGVISTPRVSGYAVIAFYTLQSFYLFREFYRLYDDIEESLRKQAALAQSLEISNAEILSINANLELIVEEKVQSIEAILRNIRQGILTVSNQNLFVDDYYSLHLHDMLHIDKISGKVLQDLLLKDCEIDSENLSLLNNSLKAVLGQDVIGFDMNSSNFPRDATISIGGSKHFFEFNWDPICDEHGTVQKVLLAMRDITEVKQQKEMNQKLDAEISIILSIVKAGKKAFVNFIQTSRTKLDECNGYILSDLAKGDLASKILFNLHMIKGMARSLGMHDFALKAHNSEEDVVAFSKSNEPNSVESIAESLRILNVAHHKIQATASQKLAWHINDKPTIEIDRYEYIQLLQSLKKFENRMADVRNQGDLLNTMIKKSFPSLLSTLKELIQESDYIARKLAKPSPQVQIESEEVPLSDIGYKVFQIIVPHLIANALDHGIETAQQRLESGKGENGKIHIRYEYRNYKHRILFGDDGHGLDLYNLASKSETPELWPPKSHEDRLKIADLIFLRGVTTKSVATEISGRGVGMSAVRSAIEAEGGSISILLHDTNESMTKRLYPFEFEIILPDRAFLFVSQDAA